MIGTRHLTWANTRFAPTPFLHNLINQGFHVLDSALPESQAQSIQKYAEKIRTEQLFQPAKIGLSQANTHQKNLEIRSDFTHWLDPETSPPEIQDYFSWIENLKNILNQNLYLGLWEFESHLAHYPKGSFYKKHQDRFKTQDTRRISVILYLNTHWQESDGGELIIYNSDQITQPEIKIMPVFNRLVCFFSERWHEVQISNRDRLSLTGWLKVRSSFHN